MMLVALFKSLLHTTEGDTVWGKLKQKVVDAAEAPAHVAEGWCESAAEALEAHELAVAEKENEALQAQITAEQAKLDGRTKAAKELKAKLGNTNATGAEQPEGPVAEQSGQQTDGSALPASGTEQPISAEPSST